MGKKNNQLTTEVQFLNIKEILDNYTNRKFWKKHWTIFKHRDFEITWKLISIDLDNSKLSSKATVKYNGKLRHSNWYTVERYCSSIPIDNSDYSQECFLRNLCGAVIECIDGLEGHLASYSYSYSQAIKLNREEEEQLKKMANDFLDENKVKNEDIRDAYIEVYLNKVKRFDHTTEILEGSKYYYYPTARLLAYSWFNNKKKFDEEHKTVDALKKIKKKYIYSIWKDMKTLKTTEYLEEAESLLDDIIDKK